MVAQRLRTPLGVQLSLGTACIVLSWLVVAGACTRLDQYAIDHWMARVGTGPAHNSLWSALRPYPSGGAASEIVFNVWTFPASVLASGALLALCSAVLVRRGRRGAALAWIAAWVVANACEVAGKELLHRPGLSTVVKGVSVRVTGFETSFPSGHTARGLLVAFMLAAVACVFLVVSGDHTPSDVVGGALVALLVVTWVRDRRRNEAQTVELHVPGRASARTLPENQ
jgi:membrane-associated phospholipid phosphatase